MSRNPTRVVSIGVQLGLWLLGVLLLRFGPSQVLQSIATAYDAIPLLPDVAQGQPQTAAISPSPLTEDEIYQRVNPSVVAIQVQSTVGEGVGTGCIISTDGLVVTNRHVVEAGEGSLEVELANGQTYPARLVETATGTDLSDDLALIQLQGAEQLPVAPLAKAVSLQLGDPVYTIGFPDYYSNPNSTIAAGSYEGLWGSGMLKTSRGLMRPGNSGGPLVNEKGEVVGISATYSRGRGLGGAIPIDRVQEFIDEARG